MMVQPEIVYYARLTYDTGSGKIPKYVVTAEAGYYPAMDNLRGRDGRISVYLQEKRETQTKSSTPAMWLQAKYSLNLTGLFERLCLWLPARQTRVFCKEA